MSQRHHQQHQLWGELRSEIHRRTADFARIISILVQMPPDERRPAARYVLSFQPSWRDNPLDTLDSLELPQSILHHFAHDVALHTVWTLAWSHDRETHPRFAHDLRLKRGWIDGRVDTESLRKQSYFLADTLERAHRTHHRFDEPSHDLEYGIIEALSATDGRRAVADVAESAARTINLYDDNPIVDLGHSLTSVASQSLSRVRALGEGILAENAETVRVRSIGDQLAGGLSLVGTVMEGLTSAGDAITETHRRYQENLAAMRETLGSWFGRYALETLPREKHYP
jgi:hypothetical protein